MNPRIGLTLIILHHRVALRLEGMHTKRNTVGRWDHPHLDATVVVVGLQEFDTYIILLHNTIYQYIATRPILEICMVAERQMGSRVTWKW